MDSVSRRMALKMFFCGMPFLVAAKRHPHIDYAALAQQHGGSKSVDYGALAQQYGGSKSVDYGALAQQYGAIGGAPSSASDMLKAGLKRCRVSAMAVVIALGVVIALLWRLGQYEAAHLKESWKR